MAARQGKIALQLTQWVGGTIIVLMFVFVIADYLIQRAHLKQGQDTKVRLGAEGLKTYVERGTAIDESVESLKDMAAFSDYTEGQDRGFVLFGEQEEPLVYTSGVISNDPEERKHLSRHPNVPSGIEVRRVKVNNSDAVAAVSAYRTKSDTPAEGTLAYIVIVEREDQAALRAWATRAVMVLIMIAGTMLAVRIPVRKFVVAPIDGLFLAAYAASKDDYRKLPRCPVDNEFTELYDMFDRLLGHLTDTRITEAGVPPGDQMPDMEKPVE